MSKNKFELISLRSALTTDSASNNDAQNVAHKRPAEQNILDDFCADRKHSSVDGWRLANSLAVCSGRLAGDQSWQTATALPWGKGRCFRIFCRVAREVAAMGGGVFLLSKIPELKPRNRRNTLKCRSFANGNRSTTEGSFWGRRTPFRAFAFALVRGLAQWRFQGLLVQAEE